MPNDIQWTSQQARALDECATWLTDPSAPQEFRIDGYAGTGKTTLARHLAEGCRAPVFCAFTGKAASVLRKTGIPQASTIHSLLYKPTMPDLGLLTERREVRRTMIQQKARPQLIAEMDAEIAALERQAKRPRFVFNEASALHDVDLIVVDESSMVTERLRNDLASFGKKMLVLGDPGQLPPVQGSSYYRGPPDVLLTDIVRQAKDNPIIRYATMARNGETIPFGTDGAFKKLHLDGVQPRHFVDAVDKGGQLLCGKNATRHMLNQTVRQIHGHHGAVFPCATERVVILKNNYEFGVFNGVTATVLATYELGATDGGDVSLTIDYDGKVIEFLPIEALLFEAHAAGKPHEPGFARGVVPVDFGYALTVHKAQGSQWEHVIVYDDGFGTREPDVRRKWLYTAITRASEKCTIVY